jgi:hypothetical protein
MARTLQEVRQQCAARTSARPRTYAPPSHVSTFFKFLFVHAGVTSYEQIQECVLKNTRCRRGRPPAAARAGARSDAQQEWCGTL